MSDIAWRLPLAREWAEPTGIMRGVRLDHQAVGERRRPGLDLAEQPGRAEFDGKVVAEFRDWRAARSSAWDQFGLHPRHEFALRLEELDQRIAPRQAGKRISVRRSCGYGRDRRDSRPGSTLPEPSTIRARSNSAIASAAVRPERDAHRAMQSRGDHVRLAGSADADHLPRATASQGASEKTGSSGP